MSVYDELGQSVPAQVLQLTFLSLVSFHWLDPTSCQSVVIHSITVRISISSSWDFPSLPSSGFIFVTDLFPQLEFFCLNVRRGFLLFYCVWFDLCLPAVCDLALLILLFFL